MTTFHVPSGFLLLFQFIICCSHFITHTTQFMTHNPYFRSLDLLSSKAYFYFSLAYEKIQKLENIRPTLLVLYRTACVRRDEMGQAVLLNALLRNYLHYNLVDQAQTLSVRAAFPENASNNQFCRYPISSSLLFSSTVSTPCFISFHDLMIFHF